MSMIKFILSWELPSECPWLSLYWAENFHQNVHGFPLSLTVLKINSTEGAKKSWISNFELIFHPIVIGFFKWSSVLFIEWQKGDQKGVQISKFPKKTNHLYGLMMDNKNIKEINHGRRNVFWDLTWIGGYSMNYFDSDMSKSTNMVVYIDWKTVIYIYVCGKCCTQFMLPMEKSVTFTGACANEIIPNG